ncbi:hypothetical protein ACFWF3_05930, partial [Nocardia sp. NPDC060220]
YEQLARQLSAIGAVKRGLARVLVFEWINASREMRGGTSRISAPALTSRQEFGLRAGQRCVDVRLSTEVLDRIDEIVAPGTTLSPADEGYLPPSLTDAAVRRRTTIGATR